MDLWRKVKTGQNVAPKSTYLVIRVEADHANHGKNQGQMTFVYGISPLIWYIIDLMEEYTKDSHEKPNPRKSWKSGSVSSKQYVGIIK